MSAGSKIVVVDDTTEVLELIEAVLVEEGYTVVLCRQPTQAVAVIAAESPRLVILDLRMAGVGEWEIVDALKADPALAPIPIIVCSGAVAELREAEARLRAQGCDVLPKPFDIDVLVQKVSRLIGTK